MKRLRDESAQSPLLRKAQSLLDAVEPLPDSEERMLRVRRALDRPERAAGTRAGAAWRRMPALALSGMLVLFGASAFAAVRYIAARSAAVQSTVPSTSSTGHGRSKQRAAQEAAAAPSAAPALAPELVPTTPAAPELAKPVEVTAPTAVPADRAERAQPNRQERGSASVPNVPDVRARAAQENDGAHPLRASSTSEGARVRRASVGRAAKARRARESASVATRAERPTAESAAASTPSSVDGEANAESALVHRAVQALRHDGNPALAARLLAESRARSANGPLAEEALSLQVEAARALGDSVRASKFAREYLSRYPGGRYASVARSALAGQD